MLRHRYCPGDLQIGRGASASDLRLEDLKEGAPPPHPAASYSETGNHRSCSTHCTPSSGVCHSPTDCCQSEQQKRFVAPTHECSTRTLNHALLVRLEKLRRNAT